MIVARTFGVVATWVATSFMAQADLVAQQGAPGSQGGGTQNGSTPEPGATAPGTAADTGAAPKQAPTEAGTADPFQDLGYGRLEQSVEPSVFPTDISPRYTETLPEGAVVRIGRAQGEFREIVLPLGVRGYVHKDFTTGLEEGSVRAKSKLAFRYRPQTGEAPVAFVDSDTWFRVVGREGDWWVVRHAAGTAWAPAAAVVTFEADAANPTLTAAWQELTRLHNKEAEDLVAGLAAEAAAQQLSAERATTLDALQVRFRTERAKPTTEQDYTELRTDTEAFLATMDIGEPDHATVSLFLDRILKQVTIVEAMKFVAAEPKPASVEVPDVKPIRDPLANFDAIGWLRYERSITGRVTVALMKGGQVLHTLACSSGRYDLAMFDGMEVGLVGPRSRPNAESLRVLDVEALEVLRLAPSR